MSQSRVKRQYETLSTMTKCQNICPPRYVCRYLMLYVPDVAAPTWRSNGHFKLHSSFGHDLESDFLSK